MKTITTNLSEQRFLNRLDSICIRHKRFDRGYTDLDVFVVKRKQQWFRIGRHLASPPLSRTDGYLAEFIFGEYRVNDCGKVEVNYRFGKPFTSIIPCIIICIVTLPIFICLLYVLFLTLTISGVDYLFRCFFRLSDCSIYLHTLKKQEPF